MTANQPTNQPNHVINNERKKERKTRINLNFYLNGSDKRDIQLLEDMETLRHRDRWSMTQFLREASMEYVSRHLPGNPAIPLTHWTKGEPLSIAAQENLTKQQNVPLKPRKRPDFKTWSTEELLRHFDSDQITPGDKLEIGQILRARSAYPKKPDYGLPLHRIGSG